MVGFGFKTLLSNLMEPEARAVDATMSDAAPNASAESLVREMFLELQTQRKDFQGLMHAFQGLRNEFQDLKHNLSRWPTELRHHTSDDGPATEAHPLPPLPPEDPTQSIPGGYPTIPTVINPTQRCARHPLHV